MPVLNVAIQRFAVQCCTKKILHTEYVGGYGEARNVLYRVFYCKSNFGATAFVYIVF